jgi:ribosome maturation factor RimP
VGTQVKVKTYQLINGEKVFRGKLIELEGGTVVLETDKGDVLRIPLESIAKAACEVVF